MDGTLDYFGRGHLPYAISVILEIIFIMSLPLMILAYIFIKCHTSVSLDKIILQRKYTHYYTSGPIRLLALIIDSISPCTVLVLPTF